MILRNTRPKSPEENPKDLGVPLGVLWGRGSRWLLLCAWVAIAGPAEAEPRNGETDVGGCVKVPALTPVASPERDLSEVEQISIDLVKITKDGFCKALKAFEFEKISAYLTPDAHVQRIFPRSANSLFRGAHGEANVLTAKQPGCFGKPESLIADLDRLTADWMRVDRCTFKPFRIFATQEKPRRALLDLHLSLGGALRTGGQVFEKVDVAAEAVEDPVSGWRLAYVKLGDWEQFRSRQPAFLDFTENAGLPTDWTDVGYEKGGLFLGQRLYGGISVGDYDGDGWPDLYITRAGENMLLRNDSRGRFTDVTEKAGVGDPGNGQAALWADFDNDGDLDLFVVNALYAIVKSTKSDQANVLYRNDGAGTFTRMPDTLGPLGPASGVAATDYDGDRLLDIFITYYTDEDLNPIHHYIEARDGLPNRLFRNLGDLTFEDVTERAGIDGEGGWSYAGAWADFDEDGDPDLYVANDYGDNTLHRNRGDGTFEEVAAQSGVLDAANGMSVDWGDYDNDGHLDLYVSNMFSKSGSEFLALYQDLDEEMRRKMQFSVEGNSLYRSLGDGTFEETARDLGASLAGWAWGSNFFDYDNDGWLDLHVANGFWAGASRDRDA